MDIYISKSLNKNLILEMYFCIDKRELMFYNAFTILSYGGTYGIYK